MTVVDAERLSIVRTVRTPSPAAVARLPDESSVELFAFNAGTARTLDLGSLKLGGSRPLPIGKGPLLADGQIWFVEGDRSVDERAPAVRIVEGRRAAVMDTATLQVTRRGPDLPEPWAVVGIDAIGRPLVATRLGWVLLDPRSLAPVARVTYHWGEHFGGYVAPSVALLPDGRSAIALPHSSWPERLWLFRW